MIICNIFTVYIRCKSAEKYCITSMLPSCRIDNNAIHCPSSAMDYNLQQFRIEQYLTNKIPCAYNYKHMTVL